MFHLFALVVLTCLLLVSVSTTSDKCGTCRTIARRFREGIEQTTNSNFGGGNTNWEERKLGTYAFSETRFLEIFDNSCEDGSKECHHMLEKNEELLEIWWFEHFAREMDLDLFEYFCIDKIKVCCPGGTYGADCSMCPGGREQPCSGHGKCQGNGTRAGSGLCSCDEGYDGALCSDCAQRFHRRTSNDSDDATSAACIACDNACKSACHGEQASECEDCKEGWSYIEGSGCIDVDECLTSETKLCTENQFCKNQAGSYACIDCDSACVGCTDIGADHCVACSNRHYLENDFCHTCHAACATSCSDPSPLTCDSCAAGWTKDQDLGCKDEDECGEGRHNCGSNSFCVNTAGSFLCHDCQSTCNGCTGSASADCTQCANGYQMNEQHVCIDVDECVVNDAACTGVGERCVNTIGAFQCECASDYTRVRGKCQLKNKVTKKKTKEKVDDQKLSASQDPSPSEASPPKAFEGKLDESLEGFQQSLSGLGQPIPGVPLEDTVVMEENLKPSIKEVPSSNSNYDKFDPIIPKKTKEYDVERKKQSNVVHDDL